jgi:hypothetical protein
MHAAEHEGTAPPGQEFCLLGGTRTHAREGQGTSTDKSWSSSKKSKRRMTQELYSLWFNRP